MARLIAAWFVLAVGLWAGLFAFTGRRRGGQRGVKGR